MIVNHNRIEELLLDAFRQGASYDDIVKILAKQIPFKHVSLKCVGLNRDTHELEFQVIVRL